MRILLPVGTNDLYRDRQHRHIFKWLQYKADYGQGYNQAMTGYRSMGNEDLKDEKGWQSRQTQPKCLGGEVCFIAHIAPNTNAYNNLNVLSYRSESQKSGEVLTELKLKVWVGCVHATTSAILRLLEAACISGL